MLAYAHTTIMDSRTYTFFGYLVGDVCVLATMTCCYRCYKEGSYKSAYQGLYGGTLAKRRCTIYTGAIYVFFVICAIYSRGQLGGVSTSREDATRRRTGTSCG